MIRLNIETFTNVVGRGALRAPSPCRPSRALSPACPRRTAVRPYCRN